MSNFWSKIIKNLQLHILECPYGEVSVSFIIHAGCIEKINITHIEKYMDIAEVPDVSDR